MTIVNTYDVGDSTRFRSTFTVDGQAQNPTAVFLFVKHPTGVIDSYVTGDLTNDVTGTFYLDTVLDDTGIWYYRFTSSGTVIAADEGSLIVERSEF